MKGRAAAWSVILAGLVTFAFATIVVTQGARSTTVERDKGDNDNGHAQSNPGVPFQAILDRLDDVLIAIGGQASEMGSVMRNWDEALPAAERFAVLAGFDNAAARDNNTGLVWEQAPSTALETWDGAIYRCVSKTVGGTVGWRLPSVVELRSLQDPSVAPPGPVLPPGHPFLDVQSQPYWSATTSEFDSAQAWVVAFGNGVVTFTQKRLNLHHYYAWCVRGPMHEAVY